MRRLLQLTGVLWLAIPSSTAELGTDPALLGPLGGKAVSVVVDPQDPNVVLTARFLLGLFRSVDGGEHFEPFGVGIPDKIIGLRQDPRDPQALFALALGAIFRSTDFGATWTSLQLGSSGIFSGVKDLAIPTSGTTLLALDNFNIRRSTDDGATWSIVESIPLFSGPRFDRVEFAPSDPTVAYYCGTEGVFRSNDAGATFFDPGPFDQWTQALSVAPTLPNVVFAGTDAGLYRSLDGGVTFEAIGAGLNPLGNAEFFEWEPSGSRLWYGLLDGIFYSTDTGDTWTDASAGLVAPGISVPASLAFASDGTLYLGAKGIPGGVAGGGLFRMPPTSTTWSQLGFAETSIQDVMVTEPGGKRAVALPTGLWLGGAASTVAPTPAIVELEADLRTLALDPSIPGRWVGGGTESSASALPPYTARVIVYTNEGQTAELTYEREGAGIVSDLKFSPHGTGELVGGIATVTGEAPAIIRSVDGGNSWTEIDGTTGWATRAIAWDPLQPGVVLQLSENQQWAASGDAGASWSPLLPAWPGTGMAILLAYDLFQSGVLYRGESDAGLWRSDDGGLSWNELGVSLHLDSRVHQHPELPGFLWVGDAAGQLLVSTDRGESFSVAWTAPEGALVGSIDLDTSDGTLLVGTLDAGTWELPCGSPVIKLGDGTIGSGGATPRLFTSGGLPSLGNTEFVLVGDDALGSSAAVLALGSAAANAPLFGGSLYVDSLITVTPVLTGAGGPGDGGFTYPISIPTSPALAGATLVSQYAVIDAGVSDPDGIALSDGLLVRLLP